MCCVLLRCVALVCCVMSFGVVRCSVCARGVCVCVCVVCVCQCVCVCVFVLRFVALYCVRDVRCFCFVLRVILFCIALCVAFCVACALIVVL